MFDFYLIFGAVILVVALGAALKIGLWVWVMTRIFGRPPQQYLDEPVARSGGAGSVKKWLAILGTVLGIISTSVGLVEKCSNDDPEPVRYIMPPRPQPMQQRLGQRCCTPSVSCMMVAPGLVGSVCTCVGFAGMIEGRVCE